MFFSSSLNGEDFIYCKPILGYLQQGMETIAENQSFIYKQHEQEIHCVTQWWIINNLYLNDYPVPIISVSIVILITIAICLVWRQISCLKSSSLMTYVVHLIWRGTGGHLIGWDNQQAKSNGIFLKFCSKGGW